MSKDGICLCFGNILHQLRVYALQADIAGSLVQILLALQFLPVLHLSNVGIAAVFGCNLQVRLVQIVDDHIGSTQFITFLGKNRGKLRALDGRFDQNRLSFLDIQSNLCQSIGVFSLHFSKIHVVTSFQNSLSAEYLSVDLLTEPPASILLIFIGFVNLFFIIIHKNY